VEWIPAGDAGGTGWVVYCPHSDWNPGDLILMTAGASTVSGEPVGPVSAVFHVSSFNRTDKFETVIDQPGTVKSTLAPSTSAHVAVLPYGVAPPVSMQGVGPVYRIRPEAPDPNPLLVWLPVPDGFSAGQVNPCYHLGTDDRGAWYPAENVPGWLASDAYLEHIEDGTVYLGFWVNHGGIVQLSIPDETITSSAATFQGDTLIIVAGLVALTLRRRRRPDTPGG
jgi:hypothetical protein